MDKNAKIYIAGHTGLFGSALLRELKKRGYKNFLLRTHEELDLTNFEKVREFFEMERPEYVFVAAAKVGGIEANRKYMADFTMINMKITCNLLELCHLYSVKKVLYLGSSCIYPRESIQPIKTDYLLTGSLEPTNEGYALAKITGIRLCSYYRRQYGNHFISCIPANVYGPFDNFEDENSHVIPALIKRLYEAKENHSKVVKIWGTGKALREFLYIEDAVDRCIYLMEHYDGEEPINIGVGKETSIRDLAYIIAQETGFEGDITFDASKPDGMPRRILDNSFFENLNLPKLVSLNDGIKKTIEWWLGEKIC